MESVLGVVTAVTSAITGAVVSVVVVVLSVVPVAEYSSFSSLQEKTVRLKRNMEKIMSICLTLVPYWCFRRTQYITSIGLFYK